MAKNGGLESTFNNPFGTSASETPDKGAVTKGNPCPPFSKAHDKGKDTIPVVFTEDVAGKSYIGPVEKVAASVLSGPMNDK
jgi:hypothetical protein